MAAANNNIERDNEPTYARIYEFEIVNLSLFGNIRDAGGAVDHANAATRFKKANHRISGDEYILKLAKETPREYNDFLVCLNEVMASLVYNRVFNVYAPRLILVYNNIAVPDFPNWLIASKIETLININWRDDIREITTNYEFDFQKTFLVDCIMANWDLFVRGNTFKIQKDATNNSVTALRIMRLDVGGSMAFRAQGEDKPQWNGDPDEHITFRAIRDYIRPHVTRAVLRKSKAYVSKIFRTKHLVLRNILKEITDVLEKIPIGNDDDEIMLDRAITLVSTNTSRILSRWNWYVNNDVIAGFVDVFPGAP